MNFLRKYWFNFGGVFGILLLALMGLYYCKLSPYKILMWVSFASLLFHQTEEYRIPGTFPGMINRKMFHSDTPDRYPLNPNTALIINMGIGWSIYLLAAIAGERLIWLGMTAILISSGNLVAHTFIFNLKGKTFYNAGLATSWLLFAPCIYFFFKIISEQHLATTSDYYIGITLGILVNIFGIFKPIIWLADKNTSYHFENRQLLPQDQKQN